jgi:acetolactate synthase-1/2/3 large subunit
VGADAAAAIAAARSFPGHIATLILPADTAWEDGGEIAAPVTPTQAAPVPESAIAQAAEMLTNGRPTMLHIGGAAFQETPLLDAWRLCQRTGAKMLLERSPARLPRGRGRIPAERIPYPIDQGIAAFAGIEQLILINTGEPVSFFAYPGKPGRLAPPDCQILTLSTPEQDGPAALAALAEILHVEPLPPPDPGPRPTPPTGPVTPEGVAQSIAALMPEDAIIIDEAISFGRGFFPGTRAAPPHDWVMLGGGAIGEGIPLAVGAAIAAPNRRVIALQADGSAMYSLAGLWTQARERLNVTTIILANRKYAILLGELAGVGANPGRTALDMMDLSNPTIDWLHLAAGMGIPAARATTLDELNTELAASLARPGPTLIELVL